MGRPSTGAITTGEALRIELSFLLKEKYIQKNKKIVGILDWTSGSTINFESIYNDTDCYIRLCYSYDGLEYDYKINLHRQKSNLGKGEVLYFICPVSFQHCRILYKCYHSTIWKCRKAYKNRIYYSGQSVSKTDYHNTRYWKITKKLDKLNLKRKYRKKSYQGKPTKFIINLRRLEAKQELHDNLRWLIMPKSLLKNSSELAYLIGRK
jgi:hypothetical protein